MNRESQSHIGLFQVFVVLGVLVFFTCQSFAGVSSIYKWKDEQGKVHFTDDPLKIPLHHRLDPNLEKTRALPPSKSSSRKQMSKANADSTAEDQKEQGENTDDSDAENKKKELATMQEALSFLKSDVQRYKKYKDYLPAVHHARALKSEIVAALPAKEALEKKLEEYDSTLLKNVKSFLKKSLLMDNKAKDLWPRSRGFVVERIRLNGEETVKSLLIDKLTAELALTPEKASRQTKSPKLEEPAGNSKPDALKKARKYGAYGK